MTLYVSRVALSDADAAQADAAQRDIDRHAIAYDTGICRVCGVLGPCGPYELAIRTLLILGRLPRRTPGATRPEQPGPSPNAGPVFRWLPLAGRTGDGAEA